MNLKEILLVNDVVLSINNNLDILLDYIPEIRFMIGFDQKHPHHHLDVWNHTLYALGMSEYNFDVRVALLLHDIGKPFSYQEGSVRHFKGHADVSSKMAKNILKRLDFNDEWIDYICYLIKMHDTPITKEMVSQMPDIMDTLYKIQYCDALAHHPEKLKRKIDYLEKTKTLLKK